MSEAPRSLIGLAAQLYRYLGFVARHFPIFIWVLGLTVVVLGLEYLATSLMIPLSPGSMSSQSAVAQFWRNFAEAMNLEGSARTWLWLFFILMLMRLLLGYILAVLTTWLGKRVHEALSGRVFGHILMHEPMGRVYTRSVGHYITMAGDDTFKCGTIISALLQTLVGLLTALVGLFVLFQFSILIFYGMVIFLILGAITTGFMLQKVIRINQGAVNLSRELGTTFIEALNSLRSIRSLHSERFVMSTYGGQIHRYVRTLTKIDAIKTGVKTFPVISLLILAIIALSPDGGPIGVSDASLLAATVIIIRILASIGQIVTASSHLLTDIHAIRDIDALVTLGRETLDDDRALPQKAIAHLELINLCFGYGERGTVLSGVSFQFSAGRAYAIVGQSGSGKSTLADLVLGLSLPNSGEIIVNHGSTSLAEVRSQFSLVEQQPKIFSSSVRENLQLGTLASDDELYRALEIVDMNGVIRSLPHGLDTRLSYLGENFSGGQRQRLGIARALLRSPSVLILDEATSALDSATRERVVDKLRHEMAQGIIIFITHDAEIASLADEVLRIAPNPPQAELART